MLNIVSRVTDMDFPTTSGRHSRSSGTMSGRIQISWRVHREENQCTGCFSSSSRSGLSRLHNFVHIRLDTLKSSSANDTIQSSSLHDGSGGIHADVPQTRIAGNEEEQDLLPADSATNGVSAASESLSLLADEGEQSLISRHQCSYCWQTAV